MRKGRLIVIEGSDGTGKATQSKLLERRLRKEGFRTAHIDFPGYERSFFGKLVASYLRGEGGTSVDPRLAAVLYAGDRLEAAPTLNKWLSEGRVIICDRYVDSNKAHQAARVKPKNRASFMKWIDRLEFDLFGLPKPDFTIFLNVPPATAHQLIGKKPPRAYLKGRKRDIHEANPSHLTTAQEIYIRLAKGRRRKSGALIVCAERGQLLSKAEISDRICAALTKSGALGKKR